MLSKFLFTIIALLTAFGLEGLEGIKDKTDLVDFINQNIYVLKTEYHKEFNAYWDVNYLQDYHELYDENDLLKAYLIEFDNGYIIVGHDLYLYEVETIGQAPLIIRNQKNYLIGSHFYIKENGLFFPNSKDAPDLYALDGRSSFPSNIYKRLTTSNTNELTNFIITYSIANDLQTHQGNSGEYTIYTRNLASNENDCGAQAAINITYTYQQSGINGLAKSMNSNTELAAMRNLMNWTSEGRGYLGMTFYGIWPGEFVSGATSYLPSNYQVTAGGQFGSGFNGPAVGLYFNANIVETAHYAMIIGRAQSDAWWIFKTNYDIISHWHQNHTHSNGVIGVKLQTTPSYYFVETQYRHATYVVQISTGAKWWEVWKPAWVNLEI